MKTQDRTKRHAIQHQAYSVRPIRAAARVERSERGDNGFTLVELLVVIAIIAMLVLLLLPAINSVRESARRTQCMNKMAQLILAVNEYESVNSVFPPGVTDPVGPILSKQQGMHHGWMIHLLPYLDERNLYRNTDQSVSVYHKNNAVVRSFELSRVVCPSGTPTNSDIPPSSYAAVHHDSESPIDDNNNGVFFRNSKLSRDQVSDGSRYTLFLGEVADNDNPLGWMSGTRATLRNTGTPLNMTGPDAPKAPSISAKIIKDFDPDAEDQTEVELLEDDLHEDDSSELDDESDEVSDDESSRDDERKAEDIKTGDVDPEDEILIAKDEPNGNRTERSSATREPVVSDDDPFKDAKQKGLYVGGFGSQHPTGAIFAFGDGHVKFITHFIDPKAYQLLGNRADGQILNVDEVQQ